MYRCHESRYPAFRTALDAGEHPHAEQQLGDVVDQLPARRCVIDPTLPDLRVPTHRSIRRPQVPQEQRHLIVRQRENLCRHELFVAALAEQPQTVQPGRDRIALAVRQPVRRRQPQRRHPGCRVVVTHGRHAEVRGRSPHRRQVLLVDAAYRMGCRFTHDPSPIMWASRITSSSAIRWVSTGSGTTPRYRQPITDRQLAQRSPAVERHERVVAGRLDLSAGGQPQPEHLLVPAVEHVRSSAGPPCAALVQRPHQRPLTGAHQLAERHLGAVVGAQDSRRCGQAARLAQVGQHRLLVGALLRATVELADRHHRNLEFLGQQLEAAGELRDLLLARLDPSCPSVISCR